MKVPIIKKDTSIDRGFLARLILNKDAENIVANPFSIVEKPDYKAVPFSVAKNTPEIEDLTLCEQLQLFVSQNTALGKCTRSRLVWHHYRNEIKSNLSRYVRMWFIQFVMLMSGAAESKLLNPSDCAIIMSTIREYPTNHFFGIHKDVDRTVTKDDPLWQPLMNVLISYAIRNPRLHYCQGLNNIAIHFLKTGYSENQTFWILVRLIQYVLPPDFYLDMKVVLAMTRATSDLISQRLPNFMKLARELELNLEIFLVEWLVTLFTKNLPIELSTFIIELLVTYGMTALIRSSLTLLIIVSQSIEGQFEDQFELIAMIRERIQSMQNISEFKSVYRSTYVNQHFLQTAIELNLLELEGTKQFQPKPPEKGKLPVCSTALPACLHVLEIAKSCPWTMEVTTLRVGARLDVLSQDDYFSSSKLSQSRSMTVFREALHETLIGRSDHICQRKSSIIFTQRNQKSQIEAYKPEYKASEQLPRVSEMHKSGIYQIEMLLDQFEESEDRHPTGQNMIDNAIDCIRRSQLHAAPSPRFQVKSRKAGALSQIID